MTTMTSPRVFFKLSDLVITYPRQGKRHLQSSRVMLFALRLRGWFLSILSALLFLMIVLWLSALIYGSFYFAYMPNKECISLQTNWLFQPCSQEQQCIRRSNLYANISLDQEINLLPGQRYTLTLELKMPQSERNRNLGMFLVCVDLESEVKIKKRCRSALMPYKSKYRELAEDIIRLPCEIPGLCPNKVEIFSVIFYEDFEESFRHPLKKVNIEILTQTGDFFPSEFRIFAQFHGLRHIMFHHPIISTFVGITVISNVIFTIMFFFWKKLFEPNVVVSISNTPEEIQKQQERARNILVKNKSSNRCQSSPNFENIPTVGSAIREIPPETLPKTLESSLKEDVRAVRRRLSPNL